MLLDWGAICERYQLPGKVTGVLHCGAHLAEEAPEYGQAFGPDVLVWWVEANPAVLPKIEQALAPYWPSQRVIHALLLDRDGVNTPFHVTNYDGMSSSVLEFGTHRTFHPDTVFVDEIVLPSSSIDAIVKLEGIHSVNMLVMDLQGAELLVLQGATELLPSIDFVITEVNYAEVYKNCAQVEQLDGFLGEYGLDRVETLWVSNFGWGDAFYVKKTA